MDIKKEQLKKGMGTTAQQMYKAYGEAVGGQNHRGEPMPAWEDLPEKIQGAWLEAAYVGMVKGTIAGMKLAHTAVEMNMVAMAEGFNLTDENE